MLKEKAFPLQRIWGVLSCGPTSQTSGGGAALTPPPPPPPPPPRTHISWRQIGEKKS